MSRARQPALYGIKRSDSACPSSFTGLLYRGPCPDCGHTLFTHNADQTCNTCEQQKAIDHTLRRIRRKART